MDEMISPDYENCEEQIAAREREGTSYQCIRHGTEFCNKAQLRLKILRTFGRLGAPADLQIAALQLPPSPQYGGTVIARPLLTPDASRDPALIDLFAVSAAQYRDVEILASASHVSTSAICFQSLVCTRTIFLDSTCRIIYYFLYADQDLGVRHAAISHPEIALLAL